MRVTKHWQEKVARDVLIIERNALHCISIDAHGVVTEVVNDRPRMDCVAVIGPTQFRGVALEKAVLLEIGLRKAKPYSYATIPPELKLPGEANHFAQRYNHFGISQEQYIKVAPCIFGFIQEYAADRVNARSGGWQKIPIGSLRGKGVRSTLRKQVLIQKGYLKTVPYRIYKYPKVRFSVNAAEPFFVNDIFYAEVFRHKRLRKQMKAMAVQVLRLLEKCMNAKNPVNSRYFGVALEQIERFAQPWGLTHLQDYFLRRFVGKKHYLYDDLRSALSLPIEAAHPDLTLARTRLVNPVSRIGKIQLRVHRKLRGNLLIDVYPPEPSRESTKIKEEIPF